MNTPTPHHPSQDARRAKRALGEVTGRIPLGYRSTVKDGVSVLEVDPDVMPIVAQARALHAEGCSVRKVLRIMTARGMRTRKGALMRPMDMWRVLKSEAYGD